MSPAALRIIDYIGCIVLVFHAKELSITILRWLARWIKDSVLPVEMPTADSMWLQNCTGMSWGTTGYYEGELDPFAKFPGSYEIWFRPGTRWLVIDSGESSRDDYWWIDVIELKSKHTNKVRIFANRHAIQEWRKNSNRMLRIDDVDQT